MSEPLSATEIEDVLSSIRRLVSEDMRPVARVKEIARHDEVQASGKLILTPALRVVESAEPAAVATPGNGRLHLRFPDLTETAPSQAEPESASIESVVASVGAAVDAAEDEWEAETGDPDLAVDEESAAQAWDFEETDETLDEIYVADATASETANDRDLRQADAKPLPGWAQTEDEFDDPIAVQAAASTKAQSDTAWARVSEDSVMAALAEPSKDQTPQDPELEDDDDLVGEFRFNEDVLRELVRDMLREELAGSMGERITRNIRKLVRAEIARSLTSQEFG